MIDIIARIIIISTIAVITAAIANIINIVITPTIIIVNMTITNAIDMIINAIINKITNTTTNTITIVMIIANITNIANSIIIMATNNMINKTMIS